MSEEPTSPIPTTSPKNFSLSPRNLDKNTRRFIASGASVLVVIIASVLIFSGLNSRKGPILAVATATSTIPVINTPTTIVQTATDVATPTVLPVATPTVRQSSPPSPTTKPVPTATKPPVAATPTPNIIAGILYFDWSSSSITCGSSTQVGRYPSLIVSNGYGDLLFGASILYYDHNGDKNPSYTPVLSPVSGMLHGSSQTTLTVTDPRSASAAVQSGNELFRGTSSYIPKMTANGPVYSVTVQLQVTLPHTYSPTLYTIPINCF